MVAGVFIIYSGTGFSDEGDLAVSVSNGKFGQFLFLGMLLLLYLISTAGIVRMVGIGSKPVLKTMGITLSGFAVLLGAFLLDNMVVHGGGG